MKRALLKAFVLFGILSITVNAATPTIYFNEIMFHPPGTNRLEQWFELYNPTSKSVGLSGWKITRGVSFTFPTGTVIAANGYLVVAADGTTFHSKYPAVGNYVAGWTGSLGHHLELSDASGKVINAVEFYGDGDWATRVMGPVVYNRKGWEWSAPADGLGASLELINPSLPNSYAHNWAANTATNSTPGQRNSVASSDAAPFVSGVSHWPQIPKSTDSVFVTARIVDEALSSATVTLNWRVDGASSFTQTPMSDDGTKQDGIANDGVYGASIPPHANLSIIEFYITATDATGHTRQYPAFVPPGDSTRTANLLFQVDDGADPGGQPLYRIIMTEAERAYILALGAGCPDSDSDAEMNATWVTSDGVLSGGTSTQVRYNVGVRNRGHGTRQSVPHNYHVNIPSDRLWKNQAGINLNSQYTHSQVIGSAVMRKAGLAMADSRPVQVRVNGANLMAGGGNSFGSYAANEQYNNDFIQRSFPLDPDGNSYRGIRDQALCDATTHGVADLSWHGTNWNITAYTNAYFKQNNFVADDWTDLQKLISVLNVTNGTTAASYVSDVQAVINVEEWMRYFAADTLLENDETALANGIGDDYALYRGAIDTRFQALPYDMDTVMGRGLTAISPKESIFRMAALPVLDRLVKTPEFAPLYYKQLKDLADTVFSPAQMNPLLDHVAGGLVSADALANMKSFNASQRDFVLSQIPLSLSVTSTLAQVNGYAHTTTGTTSLTGGANAIETQRVVVNGQPANWSAWQGSWSLSGIALQPGLNRLAVRALGSNDVEVASTNFDIWYDDGSVVSASGTLQANTTWSAAAGPYSVTANLTVPSGVTLTIEAGASVYLAAGVSITVNGTGKILAEGTEAQHVHIGRNPAVTGNWASVDFIGTTVESRLSYVDFDSGGGSTVGGHNAQMHVNNSIVFIDHCTWPSTPVVEYISFDGSSFIVQNCVFPSYPPPSGPENLHGINGIPAGGHGILRDNYFGHTWGFNDTIDFTGGNRPGPILQVIGNVFDGASDDCLDLDSTDAWIEGNVFLHVHRDPTRTDDSRDTGSAISGGVDTVGQNSDWTIINNIFYDVDHVFLNKGNSTTTGNGGGRVAFLYNTVMHVAKESSGSPDSDIGVFDWSDDGIALPDPSIGSGLYAAYNIISDYPALNVHYDPTHQTVILNNNFLSAPWTGPGSANQIYDMRLNLGALTGIPVANVTAAQAREAARLLAGSPAIGAAFGSLNAGALQSHGIVISGEPTGTTAATTATLQVGPGGVFNWGTIGAQAFGWTQFKWKLDNGPWSAEIAVQNTPPFEAPATISLQGLSNGPHTVYVTGKNDAGFYQDDPFVYPTTSGTPAAVTASKTWIVDTNFIPSNVTIRLNEILASHSQPGSPDLVELYNFGSSDVDLSGFHLATSTANPFAFTFAPGTILGAGKYLVAQADSDFTVEGIHLGFKLNSDGDALYLLNQNTIVIDGVSFGHQIDDYSIGRSGDGTWTLCEPTFGAANAPETLADQRNLRINEWLTDREFAALDSFLEIYNPNTEPTELSGLYLSDAAGNFNRYPFPALSYIAPSGFAAFAADGNGGPGRLTFKLSSDVGMIVLSSGNAVIDLVEYGPQTTDVSEGRSPNGADTISFFQQPTPGAPNPGFASGGAITNITRTIVHALPLTNSWLFNDTGSDLGTAWRAIGFNDSAWSTGNALFYHGNNPTRMPIAIGTTLAFKSPIQSAFYFRTHFNYAGPMSNLTLALTNVIDDGVVVYLNGNEVYRKNMPSGTINYGTFASTTVSDATEAVANNVPATGLVTGDNLLAVEVHQSGLSSTDIAMALGVDVVSSETNIVSNGAGTPPLVLSEILAKNTTLINPNGTTADWIELYNPTTNIFNLDNISVTDDSANPRKWVFTPDARIGAQSRLILYFDDQAPAGTNNTGFNLPQDGATIYLFDSPARGGTLLDSVRYGLQVANLSISRIPDATGPWILSVPTPGAQNQSQAMGSVTNLRINEWMASSSKGNDWFELANLDPNPVALGGLYLTDNLTDRAAFRVEPLSFIGIGDLAFVRFDADGAPELGARHVTFNLSAKGEEIGLYKPDGTPIDSVVFGAQLTDVSQGRLPDGVGPIQSFPLSASPEQSNFLPLTGVVINEALINPDAVGEQTIELFNQSAATIDIGGWYLSNSGSALKKFRIPAGLLLGAGQYAIFFSHDFASSGLVLNSTNGDSIILSAALSDGTLTGYRTSVHFGPSERNVSFGTYATSIGADFTALVAPTFGTANAAPKIGPVVVSEIMYYPLAATVEDENLEFIELENISGAAQPLFDSSAPTNTWGLRSATHFDFPPSTTINAGERILVVGFDPGNSTLLANFKSRYSVPTGTRLFGPWLGHLGDSSESVQLVKHSQALEILVDRVDYSAASPWPFANNPGLESLQRIVSSNYGNEPLNWKSELPTAGRANTSAANGDSDGDGLPDDWELSHFGTLARDGSGDFDLDGLSDRAEYLAGTDPANTQDSFRLQLTRSVSGSVTISFNAVAAHAYRIESIDSLASSAWQTLQDIPSDTATRTIQVTDQVSTNTRFYRLRLQ